MVDFARAAKGGAAAKKREKLPSLSLLSSATLTTLARRCELKISRSTPGDEAFIAYLLCQLEGQR